MSETQVERAIRKSKSLFALLMVESNNSEEVKPLHLLTQSLFKEFKDIFPNDLTQGLPSIRGIENQINLLRGPPLPNKLVYRCKEFQRQIQELLDHGYVRERV